MRQVLLAITIVAAGVSMGYGAKKSGPPKGVAVAFFDGDRLRDAEGQAALKDFEYFFTMIHEIVERDFPDVELRILAPGELLHLPNGMNLNVQNMRPEIGYVLAAPGKKHRVLTGIQTDADFACAAAAFYGQTSPACPK
jgi:hypothetical protein